MKKILSLSILFVGIIGSSIYIFRNTNLASKAYWKINSLLSTNQKDFIKKNIFPSILINQQAKSISELKQELNSTNEKFKQKLELIRPLLAELKTIKMKSGTNIETVKSTTKLSKSYLSELKNPQLEKYKLDSGFYSGINNSFPGSGYIDFYEDDFIVISSRGY